MDGTCAHQMAPPWNSYAVVSLAPVADFSALRPAKGPDAQQERESQYSLAPAQALEFAEPFSIHFVSE